MIPTRESSDCVVFPVCSLVLWMMNEIDIIQFVIIIIIIKKVKIIVTLSIKNTAGALYKSQFKGENSYVFKIRPLFDAKYITNGYRYGHSYYRRRIGNRTQAFEWHHFQ